LQINTTDTKVLIILLCTLKYAGISQIGKTMQSISKPIKENTKEGYDKIIKDAFANNYYESLEYINFLKKTIAINIRVKKFFNRSLFLIKNKMPSITLYDKKVAQELEKLNISYCMIDCIPNDINEDQSILEYSLIPKKKYEIAKSQYKRSFRDALKQSKKHDIFIEIWEHPGEKKINKLYSLYKRQMHELNSFVLPKSFFIAFLGCRASKVFVVLKEENKEIIAYCLCFENSDNLYCSLGGSIRKFFKYKAVNILYDELIRYGCSKGLNIHLGLGMKGSGYSRFKENAGAINYLCKVFPNNERILKIYQKISHLKVVGILLRLYSFLFPKKLIYLLIPMS